MDLKRIWKVVEYLIGAGLFVVGVGGIGAGGTLAVFLMWVLSALVPDGVLKPIIPQLFHWTMFLTTLGFLGYVIKTDWGKPSNRP